MKYNSLHHSLNHLFTKWVLINTSLSAQLIICSTPIIKATNQLSHKFNHFIFLKNELGVSGHGSFGSKQKVQGNMCQGREGWTQVYGSIP